MLMTLVRVVVLASAVVAQAPTEQPWLRALEGTWVVDGAKGADAGLVLTITRDGSFMVLKAAGAGLEVVTRYDLSGAPVTNKNAIGSAVFHSRVVELKIVTEIWHGEPVGAPSTIETRYLDAPDLMVTELSKSVGATPFNRTVLRRK